MRKQIKEKTRTLQDAHAYLQGKITCSFRGTNDYVSENERQATLERIKAELLTLIKKQFPRTAHLEYAILKAHLIIEHTITEYIRFHARVSCENLKFSFSDKLDIAYLMGFGALDPILIVTVERLNKVRNAAVHKFEIDRPSVDEMLRLNSNDYDNFKLVNDRERITWLRRVCASICGRVIGHMESEYYVWLYQESTGQKKS